MRGRRAGRPGAPSPTSPGGPLSQRGPRGSGATPILPGSAQLLQPWVSFCEVGLHDGSLGPLRPSAPPTKPPERSSKKLSGRGVNVPSETPRLCSHVAGGGVRLGKPNLSAGGRGKTWPHQAGSPPDAATRPGLPGGPRAFWCGAGGHAIQDGAWLSRRPSTGVRGRWDKGKSREQKCQSLSRPGTILKGE